jgi:cytochrome c oxidase assembly protein subunit 11
MADAAPPAARRRASNARVALICVAVFFGMVGASFAAVPLYRSFCQLTGWDGTTRRATAAPSQVSDRSVEVRFDTNVRGMPWSFTADQLNQNVRLGATNLAFFHVRNNGPRPVTGRAVFNVSPESAGPYFSKLECFCFREQTLQPGQSMDFPVVYFVDARFADDVSTREFSSITLSYTFLPAVDQTPAQALPRAVASPLGGARG